MRLIWAFLPGLVIILLIVNICLSQGIKASTISSAITRLEHKNDLIFLNTIDGKLHAVGKNDGIIKWSIKEDSVIKLNQNPYFLIDPRDGSLYIFTSKEDGGLKKFTYTIAELVTASPSISTDGFFYTGDKKDEWLAIDYRSGLKLDTLTSETLSSKISIADENVIFIGRTQYTVSMFDVTSLKKVFNMTYYDYSTHSSNLASNKPATPNPTLYPFYHFTSSSDGTLVTLDKANGALKWKLKLKYPITAMYRYERDQLYRINFGVYAAEALTGPNNNYRNLFKQQKLEDNSLINSGNTEADQVQDSTFISTLYVGFYENNLYALPSLAYNSNLNLIEGPVLQVNSGQTGGGQQHEILPFPMIETNRHDTVPTEPSNSIVGHHKVPGQFDPPPDYIQPNSKNPFITNQPSLIDIQDLFSGNLNKQEQCLVDISESSGEKGEMTFWQKLDDLMQNKYVWSLFTVLLASLFPLSKTIYDCRKKRARQLFRQRQTSVQSASEEEEEEEEEETEALAKKSHSRSSNHSSAVRQVHESQSAPVISESGLVSIGKIKYNAREVLGYGCSGTFVYRGTFENRPVAVKRLLPECWTLADREVDLLRDADQHQNVLRYFCTEADSQFRYIALELCQMTLNDYIRNVSDTYKRLNSISNNNQVLPKQQLQPLDILVQATRGLDHLHSLDIVHRDIKPQNVLISFPDPKGRIFVMISDFGLCKRLEVGKNFFSNRSGVTGTDGWIAAELIADIHDIETSRFTKSDEAENSSDERRFNINEMEKSIQQLNKRITKSVDIFSLGCVYYYVLSLGQHPFGDSFRRQINILSGEYKLDKLTSNVTSEVFMQKELVEKMIAYEASVRPLTKELLAHPVYWTKAKTLQFLQDVSDRIENLDPVDDILVLLEQKSNVVLKNNWKSHICPHLNADLNKFRKYNGVNVRDLLRAIRNKKHHYRELPDSVKTSLGSLPDEFIDYFTSRFPKLIMHVYKVMQCCQSEPVFTFYYNPGDRHF